VGDSRLIANLAAIVARRLPNRRATDIVSGKDLELTNTEEPTPTTSPPFKTQTVYLMVIAMVAVGGVLRLTGSFLVPFVIALLLSFVLSPVMVFLVKHRIHRLVAVLLVLVAFLAFGFLVVLIVYQSFQSLLYEFPKYQQRLTVLIQELIGRFNLPQDLAQQFQVSRNIGNAVLSLSGNFMSLANGFMVVFIYLLFLLLEQPYLRRKLRSALKVQSTRTIAIILAHINAQISRYLAVKLLVSALTAVIVFISFTIIGVDFPLIWAVLTFLFNFIPTIGSVAISAIASIFALVQFLPEWNLVLAASLSIIATEFVIGNILDPKLLGDRLNLSPVIILFSLLMWGWLWDVAGLFLAVPLTVVIKIIFENVPGLEPVGILMGTGTLKEMQQRRKSTGKEHHG